GRGKLDRRPARLDRRKAVSLKETPSLSAASAALTDSRLATLCAEETRNAFREYEARFDEITQRARDHFLACDWRSSYEDAAERLHLYSCVLDGLSNQITDLMGARLEERAIW